MLEKILVVEDNVDQAELTNFQLRRAGYEVCVAHNGEEGLRLAYEWRPDLILLDVMLPAMSGWAVCERLRQVTSAPIIFLTVLDEEKNIVRGLKMGGDDYITKPYDSQELLARVHATLRRCILQIPPPTGKFVYDGLVIDFDRRRVVRGNAPVYLTAVEYRLLLCLAEKPGENFTHHYLLHRVWGVERVSRNSLKLYVCYLRRKLEKDPANPRIILTERGVGYRLGRPQRID
jgi:two-component system KDP operon response regulator KdpE